MPRVELRPLSPEEQALVAELHELLKTAKVGEVTPIPADLARALNDAALAAARPALLARRRLEWLHSRDAVDQDGYEWGVFRVKWENGRAVEVLQTAADGSDLDAAMSRTAASFWCEQTETWLYKDDSRKAFKNRPLDPQPPRPPQQFMVSSIKHRAGIVTLVTMNAEDVLPPLEAGQHVTLSPLGVTAGGWSSDQPNANGQWLWREGGKDRAVVLTLCDDGAVVDEAIDNDPEGSPQFYWMRTFTDQKSMPGLWKRIDGVPTVDGEVSGQNHQGVDASGFGEGVERG